MAARCRAAIMQALIAITCGEPAGIGPELCAALATREWPARLVVIGNAARIAQAAGERGAHVGVRRFDADKAPLPSVLDVIDIAVAAPVVPGKLDPANASHVLRMLDTAIDGCVRGDFAAMVTAPLHKGVINDAGIAFTGHTEYLAQRTHTAQVVMMLAGPAAALDGAPLRVALATTHLALNEVSAAITQDSLETTLRIVEHDLRTHFGIAQPRLLVAGLNPHAGEGGHMGREEIEVIEPVLARLRAEGFELVGPLPADTLFVPRNLKGADAVLAMYHDQGLPVLKFATFGHGINITLGLPIVRTSVDHGTALDLVGTGRADPGSLFAAVEAAIDIAARRADTGN